MKRLHAAIASVAAVAIVSSSVPAYAAAAPAAWHVTKIVKAGQMTTFNTVVSSGKADAWAFGYVGQSINAQEIAWHWNGRTWRNVTLPKGSGGGLAVSASSVGNVWAVANMHGGGGVALHWNGHKWAIARKFPMERNHGGPLNPQVTTFSPTNVWVYGMTALNAGTGTWHFDGHRWTYSNRGFQPAQASAVSSRDIWAIDDADPRALGHYNGKKWTTVSLGSVRPAAVTFLNAIYARTASDVWVAGYDSIKQTTFMAHWNGKVWQRVGIPGSWSISAMISDGSGGLWLSGYQPSSQKPAGQFLLHRTRTGVVTTVTVPGGSLVSQFAGFAQVQGTASLWGAGSLEAKNGSRSDGAIFRLG